MSSASPPQDFTGPLARHMADFVKEMRSHGHTFRTEVAMLRSFGKYLVADGLEGEELPRRVVDAWAATRLGEKPGSHHRRISILLQFVRYLHRVGVPAHLPDARASAAAHRRAFVPRIFTREEVRGLLAAADRLPASTKSPLRRRVLPELFRVLYGCGLRISEALKLQVGDVDLAEGILTIRNTKFGKDRLVPVAPALHERLRSYAAALGDRPAEAIFFPAPGGKMYSHMAVYGAYRDLLYAQGIPHRGRGHGPRIHDLRATFAVHRLEAWYRAGEDLSAKLPVLSAYLGHDNLGGTQWYLRLTPELFPDIAARLEKAIGPVIPTGATP